MQNTIEKLTKPQPFQSKKVSQRNSPLRLSLTSFQSEKNMSIHNASSKSRSNKKRCTFNSEYSPTQSDKNLKSGRVNLSRNQSQDGKNQNLLNFSS